MTFQQNFTASQTACKDVWLEQVEQLRAVLALLDKMTGDQSEDTPSRLTASRLDDVYARAPGVSQRRFRELTEETVHFATEAIAVLISRQGTAAAARALSAELHRAFHRLHATIGA